MIIDDLSGLAEKFFNIFAAHRKVFGHNICVCGAVEYKEHFESMLRDATIGHIIEENSEQAQDDHAQEDQESI